MLRTYLKKVGHISVNWDLPDLPVSEANFAQMAAHRLAISGHRGDATEVSEQIGVALNGARAFIDFAEAALQTYQRLQREGKL